jgi:quinol monooxygenase YgiN
MSKLGLLVRLEAKKGKEKAVEDLITSALSLAVQEDNTTTWYAFRINKSTFGIYDTFQHEEGRKAHLNGKIAQALMDNASDLFSTAPAIETLDVLAVKKANR